ncbi:MAG: enoyl-ACP reductase [Zetaproteobacteria bacterium]|nr:enoyl-ACP reductase [Zetaproteobacteria bacterium]
MLENKSGIIMGIANNRSIASAIATHCYRNGAKVGYSHLPDSSGKMKSRVEKVVQPLEPVFLEPCDVNSDASLEAFFNQAKQSMGKIDFLVHSIGFAPLEDLRCDTIDTSREGFKVALETSAYSLIAVANKARQILKPGGSILTLTYLGGERVIEGYNLMGIAKAALEAAVKYLAVDLGGENIRVNSISAGPIKTLAASAISDFSKMCSINADMAPLGRNTDAEEVAKSSLFLLSELSSGVTGENMHVDCGYHIVGSPKKGCIEKWSKTDSSATHP